MGSSMKKVIFYMLYPLAYSIGWWKGFVDSLTPSLTVYVVRYGNYEPAEISAIFRHRASAEIAVEELNDQYDPELWAVEEWQVQ